jgi:plastocyanin
MAALVTRRNAIVGVVATATTVTLTPIALSADTPTTHDIKIKHFKFDPESIQVKFGDIIRWTNEDLAPHTATANNFGWDTEELAEGDNAEITVVEGMDTAYFCAFHPHMKGAITIT